MARRKRNNWFIFFAIAVFFIVIIAGLNYGTSGSIMQPKVLVVPVKGYISLYGSSGLFGDVATSAEQTAQRIREANADPSIQAIIIEINSPGGTIVASEEISRAIEASDKPVVAWIREIGTSGGYYIAASCDKIVADRASLTGSIGVTGSYLQYSELLEEYGITYERVVSGQYKDIASPFKELTGDERALLEQRVNIINEMFIQHISMTRGMAAEDVRELATGEFILGVEAYENGMVDVLGSEAEAKAEAEKLAGVSNARLVKFVERHSLVEQLARRFFPLSSYYVGLGIGDSLVNQEDFSIRA